MYTMLNIKVAAVLLNQALSLYDPVTGQPVTELHGQVINALIAQVKTLLG